MKVVKIVLIALAVLILAGVGAGVGVYMGWFPVPEGMVTAAARAQGLDEAEAERLAQVVNVYQVIKTAPEAPILQKSFALAAEGAPEDTMKSFVFESWPQISDETLESVRDQLGIEDADFAAVTKMVDARITQAGSPENLQFTAADRAMLEALDKKYGFSELFKKFARGGKMMQGGW